MVPRHHLGLLSLFAWVSCLGAQDPVPIPPLSQPTGESWRLREDLVAMGWHDQEAIPPLLAGLGSASFQEREDAVRKLEGIGPPIRPHLRKAMESQDPEIRLRSRQILAQLPKPPSSFEVRSWLRGSLRQGPPLGLLLNLLEIIDDEALRVTLHGWIEAKYPNDAIAWSGRGSLAGRLLQNYLEGARATPNDLGALLSARSGESPLETYHRGLGYALKQGGPNPRDFAPFLESLPVEAAWQLESLFLTRHPQIIPEARVGAGLSENRAKAAAFWRHFGESVSVASIRAAQRPGPTYWVCEYDGVQGGRVFPLADRENPTEGWNKLQGPNDFQLLPGGGLLVAERNSGMIGEFDGRGNRLWQWQAPQSPIQCQRLEGGLTLYATFHEVGVLTPAGQIDWSIPIEEGVRHAKANEAHELLVLTSRGTILKIDPLGRRIKTLANKLGSTGAGYWGHLVERPNGSILACFAGTHLLIEIQPNGIVARQTSIKSPVHFQEIPGGGLIVASFDQKCLVELDAQWNEVGRRPLDGRPFVIRLDPASQATIR